MPTYQTTNTTCDHPGLDGDGACTECGESCTLTAVQDGTLCYDHECPLHGEAPEDEAGTPSLAKALVWAETAQPGEYLVRYADTGLTDAEDPGSRCGYDDSGLSMIRSTLAERSLTLAADDLGLLAAERSEEV